MRCDLAPPKIAPAYVPPQKDKAALGRDLVKRALSSGHSSGSLPSPPPPPVAASRSVKLNPNVKIEVLLENFYRDVAPEKIPEIPRVVNHFMARDKHPGILLATLEDKYKVKFRPDGSFVKKV